MIAAISILAMAVMFVAFPLLRLGEGKGCGSGNCGSCSSGSCDISCDTEAGRLP